MMGLIMLFHNDGFAEADMTDGTIDIDFTSGSQSHIFLCVTLLALMYILEPSNFVLQIDNQGRKHLSTDFS